MKTLKIGNVELKNNIILAPMAGITDRPFRLICERYNPGLVYTEMVSSKALFYGDEKTKQLLNLKDEDINMGCPAPKVVKNGDGSSLLLNLDLAFKIVEEVVKSTNKPVTVKYRKGYDNNNIIAVEAAIGFEKAGAKAIAIHGRTRKEFYSGTADWDIIKKVKQAVSIPVIGNGDVKYPEDAKNMLEQTNVDGVMIGRAAMR